MVFRPSVRQRVLFVGSGVVLFLTTTVLASERSPGWAVFGLCAIPLVLDGIRTRVVVEPERGTVASTRAFRSQVTAMADVLNLRVPPWGPLVITLAPGAAHGRSSRALRGQIVTGLYGSRRGRDSVAVVLARALDVPVVSVWPKARAAR